MRHFGLLVVFQPAAPPSLWRGRRCWLRSPVFHQREAPKVDLTLRLDALAVCAVFLFVGAIILGAF